MIVLVFSIMISVIGTRCVLFWFASLFPPASEDDIDYYEALGVSRRASKEAIRKAYKKKSLALHPDKILQRGGNPDDYRKEYQGIQEAHAVLCDDKKRQTYNLVNRSTTRYKFLTEDGAIASAYENLVKSSCQQKSRLVLLLAILMGILLFQPILVCAKINQDLEGDGPLEDNGWVLILTPWWLLNLLYLMGSAVVVLFMGCDLVVLVKFIETLCWVVGQVVLALRWDETLMADYVLIFIPIYVALVLRWLGRYLTMRRMTRDILQMITMEKLEEELGKSYQDLTEEEKEDLTKQFIIVHVPPDAEISESPDDDFVQLSPEYHQAMETYYQAFAGIATGMLFGIPIMVMIVLKVDEHYTGSWWIVFIPVWVYFGVQLLWNCYSCCCSTAGEEVVIMPSDTPGEEGGGGEEEVENADERLKGSGGGFVEATSPINEFNNKAEMKEVKKETPAYDDGVQPVSRAPAPPLYAAAPPAAASTEQATSDGVEETKLDEDYMDEEAFNEFQQAYEQAEANAVEAQAKAGSNMCGLLFQLMMMCLIVGKLQGAVPNHNDNVGYNAFWVLFPILLVAGCTLCCWACLIYSAGLESLDNLVERAAGSTQDEEAPPPPTEPQEPQEPAVPTPSKLTVSQADQPVETQSNVGGFYDDDGLD